MQLDWTTLDTNYGALTIAGSERGLAFACFGAHAEAELRAEWPDAQLEQAGSHEGPLSHWCGTITDYLARGGPEPTLPLEIQGTAFQQRVWRYLTAIPRGETRTYTQVAAAIERPAAVRAVASACGANNLSVLIPCHRVIRSDGGLGGYRGGIEIKRRLLADEARQCSLPVLFA